MTDFRQLLENLIEQELEEANAIAVGGVSATGGGPLGQNMKPTYDAMWSGNEELNERRSDSPTATPVIAYHGTTSVFLPNIINHGLSPKKEDKKNIWQGEEDDNTLDSLEGVYLGNKPDIAKSYAIDSSEYFGGDPVVLVVQVVPQSTMADEDNFDLSISFFQAISMLSKDNVEMSIVAILDPTNPIVTQAKQKFAELFHKKYSKNPNHPRPDELLSKAFLVLAAKSSASDRPYYISSAISALFRNHVMDINKFIKNPLTLTDDEKSQVIEDLVDQVQQAFQLSDLKEIQTQITKYYASEMRMQNKAKQQGSFRVNQVIGFKGRNRIVGIVKRSSDKVHWELLYGEPHGMSITLANPLQVPTWTARERQLRFQRQSPPQQPQAMPSESLVHDISMTVLENLADKMGLKKATSQVRRDVTGGSPVYMDKHDGDKEGTKKVMQAVSKNLNKKPYSKDPPRMGLPNGSKK